MAGPQLDKVLATNAQNPHHSKIQKAPPLPQTRLNASPDKSAKYKIACNTTADYCISGFLAVHASTLLSPVSLR